MTIFRACGNPKAFGKTRCFCIWNERARICRGGKCHELCFAIVAHSDSAHCDFSPLGLQNLQEGACELLLNRLEVVSFGPVLQGMFVSKLV